MPALKTQFLGAVGSLGQNTQASHIDLPHVFVRTAQNCVLDEAGRLSARKATKRVTADDANLTTSAAVKRVYRHNKADGTSVFVCAGNSKLFRSDGSTLTQIGTGYSGDRWQFASLNGKVFAAQVGHSLRWFNETTWAETTVASPANPRAITAAFGRLWAISSDGWTLHWSDLLDGTNFTTGASGSLDLQKTHTITRSPAVAVVAFDRGIAVLCEADILLLGLADNLNPNDATQPIYLRQHVPNIGCVARDSVAPAGDDLMFLDSNGVFSLRRALVELRGPAQPMELTATNRDALARAVAENTAENITAAWHQADGSYYLFLPDTAEVWVLDMSVLVPDPGLAGPRNGAYPAATKWTFSAARLPYHGTQWTDDALWFGMVGGLGHAKDYDSTDSYTMTVETGWLSLGDQSALKHLKRVAVNLYGGHGQTAVLKWFTDFNDASLSSRAFTLQSSAPPAEYGIAQFNISEFTAGQQANDHFVQAGSSFRFVKFALEFPVSAREVSLNSMLIYFVGGRVL